jgi:hypothetical protein
MLESNQSVGRCGDGESVQKANRAWRIPPVGLFFFHNPYGFTERKTPMGKQRHPLPTGTDFPS